MKFVTVLGARPQFIKAACVSRELKKQNLFEVIIHTGQHYDANMSQVFFDEMEIPAPHYNLEVGGISHGAMTGRMIEKIEEVLQKEQPDGVLVYGDTNSTLAGALAASKLHIPIAHVEAGLRSFDMKMPEEINRVLTDRVSKILFCPTKHALENLSKEGFSQFNCEIVRSGDVMYDAVLYYKHQIERRSRIIQKEKLDNTPFVLVTLHRAENTNDVDRLNQICNALNEINEETRIIVPLHPRTKTFLQVNNIALKGKVIEPVGYFDMLALLENCKMVLTDSGGLQKEAYFFGKYCLTLRDQTEWIELVEEGANAVVGATTDSILSAFHSNLGKHVSNNPTLFGDGHAATIVTSKLKEILS